MLVLLLRIILAIFCRYVIVVLSYCYSIMQIWIFYVNEEFYPVSRFWTSSTHMSTLSKVIPVIGRHSPEECDRIRELEARTNGKDKSSPEFKAIVQKHCAYIKGIEDAVVCDVASQLFSAWGADNNVVFKRR